MARFIILLVSSIASVAVARSFETAMLSSQGMAYRAMDSATRSILRRFAWTLVGVIFFTSGVIMTTLEVSSYWEDTFILSMIVRVGVTLVGVGCLYAGLSAPKFGSQESGRQNSPIHGYLSSKERVY